MMKILFVILIIIFTLFFLGMFYNKNKKTKKLSEKEKALESRKKKASARILNESSNINHVSYGPKVDAVLNEGKIAIAEMARLYSSIPDENVKKRINEIMYITDKIMQDAINDPNDVSQIKKFFSYYLPTTIKLLNTYDRMNLTGVECDNIDGTKQNITDMLDVAVQAYQKRLDSLFENQAIDIETDIDVMNQMLKKDGLLEQKGV